MKLLAVMLLLFLSMPATVNADTLLMGFDSELMDSRCFLVGRNITDHSWKAFRWAAQASGTIGYFKLRLIEPTQSVDDNLCWAIYDDRNGSVGALKAYGCYERYNWNAIGVGEHRFGVTNIVTNLSVTAGTYYWLVAYSRDMDETTRTCPSVIPTQRGNGECAPGIVIHSTSQNTWLSTSSPPPPNYYNIRLNSYHAWSVWSSSGSGNRDMTPPAPPTVNQP